MKETVKWGVLGAAAIATERTMPAIHAAPSWRIEDELGMLCTIKALFESARSAGWTSLPQ
jgi:hypothetical protein